MRCSECGATNPDSAAWCSQCLASFAQLPEEPPDPDRSGAGERSTGTAATAPRLLEGGFQARGDLIEWICTTCEEVNPLDAAVCQVCGTAMGQRYTDHAHQEIDWTAARRRELVLPGLGHLRTPHAGQGIARMVLFLLWGVSGLLVAVSGGAGLAPGLVLLSGAAVLYATGPADLDRLRDRAPPLLDNRRFMWLVVVVTAVFMVTGAIAAIVAGPIQGT